MCDIFTLEQLQTVPGAVVFDRVTDYLISQGKSRTWAIKGALVFGTILRYSTMTKKICYATAGRIADDVHCTARTFYRHRDELIRLGLVNDWTPGLRNAPHQYTITVRGFEILALPSCDILTAPSCDILAIPSCDILADDLEDDDESNKSENRNSPLFLNSQELENLENWESFKADFGHLLTAGAVTQLNRLARTAPDALNDALLATVCEQPQKIMHYIARCVKNWRPDPEPPPAAAPPPRPGPSDSLLPQTPEAIRMFTILGEEFSAKGQPIPTHFDSLAQRRRFETAGKRLNGSTLGAVESAILNVDPLTIKAIVAYVAKFTPAPDDQTESPATPGGSSFPWYVDPNKPISRGKTRKQIQSEQDNGDGSTFDYDDRGLPVWR